MNLIILNFLLFYTFFFSCNSYELNVTPLSRNLLCSLNINKNCSDKYILNKDKELFFLTNNKNNTNDTNNVLKEYGKDRWVYTNHYFYPTNKYIIIPFQLYHTDIKKVFIFFPINKYNEESSLDVNSLNLTNVCYKHFYKSYNKFSCVMLKENIEPLLNKKISLYTILDLKSNKTVTYVFDIVLKQGKENDKEYNNFIDKYEKPSTFDYIKYFKKSQYVKNHSENNPNTECNIDIDLEKCKNEKYISDPCDKNKFYFCYIKGNEILKIKLSCYKNFSYNTLFKICEK